GGAWGWLAMEVKQGLGLTAPLAGLTACLNPKPTACSKCLLHGPHSTSHGSGRKWLQEYYSAGCSGLAPSISTKHVVHGFEWPWAHIVDLVHMAMLAWW
ncbi:hypothetical protein COO60DRAFT_1562259, partial [Scenedesmus sp. NREL 46B-D3]